VVGYDPFLSTNTALRLNPQVKIAETVAAAAKAANYLTIHVPYNKDTHEMLNAEIFAQMPDGARIINLARGELVDNNAIKEAIAQGKIAYYVTDFPTAEVLEMEKVIALPHIGASTPEAEENCATMAALQLKDYLENGNIKNSVNYANCALEVTPGMKRLSIAAQDNENLLAEVTAAFQNAGVAIADMTQKVRKQNVYVLLEAKELPEALIAQLAQLGGVKKVRVIR